MRMFFTAFLIFIFTGMACYAQLPPVFGPEYQGITQQDEMTRTFISPLRVMWTSDTTGELIKNTEVLLKMGNSQSSMSPHTQFCSIKSTDSDTSSILLDYGKELHGGLQLVMGGSSRREPSLVRIRFGESVGEANSQTYNSDWLMGFSTDDHAKRDIIMEIPRSGLIEIGNTGFRFVRIDLLQPKTLINLKEARAILRYRNIPYLGSFKSSNPKLDSIWITGAYTTHLNMQEYLWDGIKRDRLVWLGDFNIEWMENTARLDEFTPEGMNDIHGSFGDYCYPSYRHSLCHGWSSGVTAWLTKNVLGIKVMEAGGKTLKIEPHLGNLEWVEGSFPTPLGVVKVKQRKLKNGEIESTVDAPEGIKII